MDNLVQQLPQLSSNVKQLIKNNEKQLKYLSYLSWAYMFFRILILGAALLDFYQRDKGLLQAKNERDIDREHKRWVLKFGNNGIVDIFLGLIIAIFVSIIWKILQGVDTRSFTDTLLQGVDTKGFTDKMLQGVNTT